jgi:hypothetical protein
MKRELTFDAVLAAVDGILELPQDPSDANSLWQRLDPMLDRMLLAAKIDAVRHQRLSELLSIIRAAASELTQSLVNAKRGGYTRDDWMRFAERDLIRLKDELSALREFMIEEADFLRFTCLRTQLEGLGRIKPEKLFEELHEAGAISEHTWALLVAQLNSWRKALKDREISKQLVRISGWLLDLQEARRERILNVSTPKR